MLNHMDASKFSDKEPSNCLLVYEGRLGSARADSTYVLGNAEVFSEIMDVELIESASQVIRDLIYSLTHNKSIRNPKVERLEQYNWDYRNQRILKYCQEIFDLENE